MVIGTWECIGGKKPKEAQWFSVRLNAQNTPRLHRWDEPIAALELLATLYAVIVFMPRGGGVDGSATIVGKAATDNKGNTYLCRAL